MISLRENVFTMINFPAGADAHHESFASSYFRNFNLIDQFTIWPASPVYYLVFFSNKVLCRLVNVYCLSSAGKFARLSAL